MKRRMVIACGLAAAITGISSGAQAAVIDFTNFSTTAGLTLNGNAAQVGNVIRVTPALDWQAGSFFSTNTVSLASNASFSTYFQFRFTNPDLGFCDSASTCGADGLVFVVQTVANNVGASGGGIGYFGINNSLGIEFDTWNNTSQGVADGNSSNHVGINTNGSINSLALLPVSEADMNLGDIWNAWVDYNGATNLLELRLTRSTTRPVAALLSQTLNLASILGSPNAFVGFTSGTGASHANHDVLRWQLENTFAPIGSTGSTGSTVPEPASFGLMGLGMAAVALARRWTLRR